MLKKNSSTNRRRDKEYKIIYRDKTLLISRRSDLVTAKSEKEALALFKQFHKNEKLQIIEIYTLGFA